MTAPDPRVGELYDRYGTEPCPRHEDCTQSNVAFLLAELREAQEALARVEALANTLAPIPEHRTTALRIRGAVRAAVAATNGDG